MVRFWQKAAIGGVGEEGDRRWAACFSAPQVIFHQLTELQRDCGKEHYRSCRSFPDLLAVPRTCLTVR